MKSALLVAVLFCAGAAASRLPDYITPCRKSDSVSKLNECALEQTKIILPKILNGEPLMRIPNLNPVFVKQMVVEPGSTLRLNLYDIRIYGVDKAKVLDAMIKIKKRTLSFIVEIPVLSLIGNYAMNGSISILPVNGDGKANITFVDARVKYVLNFSIEKVRGVERLREQESKVNMIVSRAYYQFENLLKGNKLLSNQLQTFMLENWEVIQKDLGPLINGAIAEVVSQSIAGILDIPYSELLVVD